MAEERERNQTENQTPERDVIDEIITEFRGEAERESAAAPEGAMERDAGEESVGIPRKWWIVGGAVAAALVAAFAAFCLAASTSGTIVPHTFVSGVDVGGMTRDEAARAIAPALDTLRADSGVRVTLEDGAEAAYLSYGELGAVFDAAALADEAYAYSHSGSALIDGWTLFGALLGRHTAFEPEPVGGWTEDAAEKLASAASLEPADFSYEITKNDALLMTKGRDGRSVDAPTLRASLNESVAGADGTRVVSPPYTVAAAEQGDLTQLNDLLGGGMANARYDAQTSAIVPERAAFRFDVAQAQALLDAAAPGETVNVPAEVFKPAITADELEKVLFRDVLGTYTTRVGGAAGRKANVRLTAERVNGAVLNSGEEFNYYALTGPFSSANGYKPAPGYQNGKTVPMDGGGACQCSSTAYAAALLANMEIVKRTAHGFASDYIGLGLDATVSGGGPDFIFRNNTPYPVKVEAVYSDNHRLTVNIIGTKTDETTVKIRTVVLSTTPYQEEFVEDPALAPGQRVVDQTPYIGYTVNTYRQLYDGEGKLISESFEAFSRYNKRNRIIHVAPGELPGAEIPAQAPTETPAEAPAEVPAQAPAEAPAQAPTETPTEAPAQAPAEKPAETPAGAAGAPSAESGPPVGENPTEPEATGVRSV